jgi:outer membrane receptor protein involved in Fe transport
MIFIDSKECSVMFCGHKLAGPFALSLVALGMSAAVVAGPAGSAKSKVKVEENTENYEKIIVYGQKVARSLQETASSVVVLSADDINDNADQATVAEILRGIANFNYAGNTDAPVIRGTDTKGPVSAGNAYLAKPVPGATISLDGRYLTAAELDLGAAGLWDLAGIEVYRGPQTTSQGANSIAGAVVMRTNKPVFSGESAAQVIVGSRDKKRVSFMASDGITEDIAFRIALDQSSRDTFIRYTNPQFTAHDFDLNWKNQQARAKLLWQPTGTDLSALMTYSYSKAKRPNSEMASEPYDQFQNLSLYQDNQQVSHQAGMLELEYEFAKDIQLHHLLQYSDGVFDYYFAAPYQGLAKRDNENMSSDLRLEINKAAADFSGVAGLFYWKDQTRNWLHNTFGTADADLGHTSAAPYAELNWRLLPDWTLSTGLRYQRDDISHAGTASYVPGVFHQYQHRFHAVLPKLALSYGVTEHTTVGALVNKGYIPGGTGINFRAGQYYSFAKESAWNYELFSRTELPRQMTLSSNLFYTRFRDSQRSVTDYLNGRPFGSVIINADQAQSYGLELGLDYRSSPRLRWSASLGLLETEITRFDDYRGQVFVGKEFSKAPGFMASAGLDYAVTDSWSLSLDHRISDGYFSTDINEPELRVATYSSTDLRSSYQLSSQLSAFVYIRNLSDKTAALRKVADRSTGGFNAYMLEPREAGIGLKANF